MKVKVVLGGEAVNIPQTDIGLGVAFIRVWVDGNGFTSASNDLGSLGYILLETPEVDIGSVDAKRERVFTSLHGTVVHWNIKPNIFFKDGGIANITMPYQCSRTAGSSRRRSNSSLQTARAWPSSAMPSISPARCSRSRRRSLSSTATRSCPMTSSLLPLTQRRRPLLRAKPLSELAELPPVPVQQPNPESEPPSIAGQEKDDAVEHSSDLA